MAERMTLEEIRKFWTEQAALHGVSHAASWSDHPVMELEVREIVSRLRDGARVLDVGCANGFSTVQFASQKQVRIRGLDYIPGMIDQARARLATMPALRGEVEFDVGDITALGEPDGSYDAVVVIRVVINLGNVEAQAKALRECARVLRPGGLLLLSEATVEGWRNLNALRVEWGLPEIPMPGFNLYLEEARVADAVRDSMDLVEVVNFASTYFVMSRVVKPLLAKATGAPVAVADPASHWNRWASQWPAIGDYGTQKLFVLRKR